MTEVCFYISMISLSLFLVGMVLIASEVTKKDKGVYEETGQNILFNPFKQIDFLLYILARKYKNKSGRNFHVYDLMLLNIVIMVLSFICFTEPFSI